MGKSVVRKKLKAAELEAAIMQRLGDNPDCAGIVHIYVKATGHEPPEETWMHTLVCVYKLCSLHPSSVVIGARTYARPTPLPLATCSSDLVGSFRPS